MYEDHDADATHPQAMAAGENTLALGPFVSAQRLLLEDDKPVRLGGRAFDMLAAAVERAGRVVGKEALIAWAGPQTFLEEPSLQIEVSALWRTEVELYNARRVQQILDSIPTAAGRARSDGFAEYINKRWLEYAGISLEQALGWQWLVIITRTMFRTCVTSSCKYLQLKGRENPELACAAVMVRIAGS